jgi:hypothetical protein
MKTRNLFAMLSIATPLLLSAQEQLSKEITIEREIVPEVRAASRLNLYPQTLTFNNPAKTLTFSDNTTATNIPASIAALNPAATEAATPLTPWRGYVGLGYFPGRNFSLSAGYGILSTESNRLNVWLQADNTDYKAKDYPNVSDDKQRYKHLAGRFGIDYSHLFSNNSRLDLNTNIGANKFSPSPLLIFEAEDNNQTTVDWDIDALWHGNNSNDLSYHIGAGAGIFNFTKGIIDDWVGGTAGTTYHPSVRQTGYNINAGIAQAINNESAAGVDFTTDLLHYNHFYNYQIEKSFYEQSTQSYGSKTLGVVGLTPHYRFANKLLSVKIGALLNYTFNSGKKFHIAPDVTFGINPSNGFGAWLNLAGGEHLNTLNSLFAYTPYTSPINAYYTSNIPIKGDLGLRFGPIKGASLSLQLSYAAANNWLMPYDSGAEFYYIAENLRSWKAGAYLHWAFRNLLDFDASFETRLSNDDDKAWFEWRDRARHVFSTSLSVRPISPLTITASYQLRTNRHNVESYSTRYITCDLKDVSNLSVGAAYRITDAFSVFARGENLLNTYTLMLDAFPLQGATGLVGVTYKF